MNSNCIKDPKATLAFALRTYTTHQALRVYKTAGTANVELKKTLALPESKPVVFAEDRTLLAIKRHTPEPGQVPTKVLNKSRAPHVIGQLNHVDSGRRVGFSPPSLPHSTPLVG